MKDRTIAHAILDAYSVASNRERSPEVHLFIEMPPDRVDVNVHPTKAEVRFREQSLVHEVVRRAVGDALGTRRDAGAAAAAVGPRSRASPYAQSIPGVLARRRLHEPVGACGCGEAVAPVPVGAAGGAAVAGQERRPATASQARSLPRAPSVRPMIPLGQFRDTFIVAIDDEGICIIDQHVAHERVLFERVMERLTAGTLESQRLLVPMMLELAPAEREALVGRAADARSASGSSVEEFGGDTVQGHGGAGAAAARRVRHGGARAGAGSRRPRSRPRASRKRLKRIAATTACHAAVKANYPLTMEKMRHILEELRATAYSTVCPHGRPVMLRITRREVEKNFERI